MHIKIAVPINESGMLDSHFGHSKFFSMITVEEGKIISDEKLVPPPHKPGALPKWLVENGVTKVIAGGMGQKAIAMLSRKGVGTITRAPQLSSTEIVEQYLNKSLSLTGENCNHNHEHNNNHNCGHH